MTDTQTQPVEIGSYGRYKRVWHEARERQMAEVLAAIKAAKDEYGERINCAFLHRILKLRFPFATAWMSPDHVLTDIEGVLYDRSGVVAQRAILADDQKCSENRSGSTADQTAFKQVS